MTAPTKGTATRKECHSTSYDALTAHVAIVFARYILLSLEQRRNADERSIGGMFYLMIDELKDIAFADSLNLLVDAVLNAAKEVFRVSEKQIDFFVTSFRESLPSYLLSALERTYVAV